MNEKNKNNSGNVGTKHPSNGSSESLVSQEQGLVMQPCRLCGAEPLILPQFHLGTNDVRQVGFAVVSKGKRPMFKTGDEAKREWITSQEGDILPAQEVGTTT